MPTEIARWYDWMDALDNYDYVVMSEEELFTSQKMYYEIAREEFPDLV